MILSSLILELCAQSPQNYPTPGPERVEITPFNVLMFIVLPVLIVVAYIWIRRRSLKKKP